LGDLLGHGATPNGDLRQAQHARLVATDQRDVGRLVAYTEALDQLTVIVHATRR
jgi:hypothetical protein